MLVSLAHEQTSAAFADENSTVKNMCLISDIVARDYFTDVSVGSLWNEVELVKRLSQEVRYQAR